MYTVKPVLLCILCTIVCSGIEQLNGDCCDVRDGVTLNANAVELQEDDFLAQLFALSQEAPDTTMDDKFEIAIREDDGGFYKSFLYIYLAPYYVSLLLLYDRMREYLKECKNLLCSKKDI